MNTDQALHLKLYRTESIPSYPRYPDPPCEHFQVIENIGDNKWVRYFYNLYEGGSERKWTEVWTTFEGTNKWDKGVDEWDKWPFAESEKESRWNQVIQFLHDEGYLEKNLNK